MATYRVRDGVEWRAVADEIVVLDLRTERYLALNPSGAVLWAEMVEGASVDQLVARLQDEFAVEDAQAASDVEALLEELTSRGLVVDAETGDDPAT